MAFGQNRNMELGLSVSPSFYMLTSANGFDHKYHTNANFITGIDISFPFFKQSNLLTGLYYSSVRYKVEYEFLVEQPGDPLIPRYGHISANYFEIPLIYVLKLASSNKFFIYSSPGIIPSILISSNDKTTFEDNSTRSSQYLNSFLSSLQLGAGMKYKLSDKWQIKIEPQYRLALKGIDKMMYQKPSSLNIPFGVIYTLPRK
jgi:hypothetical protein